MIVTANDVRTVATARVARLHWTTDDGREWADTVANFPGQVAVTKAGIWFLRDGATDHEIARVVATTRPTYADHPATTSIASGAFTAVWRSTVGDAFCVGRSRDKGPQCSWDTCDVVCFAPSAGVVRVAGMDARGGATSDWKQAGWDDVP